MLARGLRRSRRFADAATVKTPAPPPLPASFDGPVTPIDSRCGSSGGKECASAEINHFSAIRRGELEGGWLHASVLDGGLEADARAVAEEIDDD